MRDPLRNRALLGSLLLVVAGVIVPGHADLLAPGRTQRITIGYQGDPANNDSLNASMTDSGRFVSFSSRASNIVAGDGNEATDIFLTDVVLGVTERISESPVGEEAGVGAYGAPAMTPDGRFVAFASWAMNLVPGDGNALDVFVKDRQGGTLERMSVSTAGEPGNDESFAPSISADGRLVTFMSYATNLDEGNARGYLQVFLRDRLLGTTSMISRSILGGGGNNYSLEPKISADGTRIAFWSSASDLVPGDANGKADVFVFDRPKSEMILGSVSSTGQHGDSVSYEPSISGDGRHVAFTSLASNLTSTPNDYWNVFTKDLSTGEALQLTQDGAASPMTSSSGRFIAYWSDGVYVWDRSTGIHTLATRDKLSQRLSGFSPFVSSDGRYVSFVSASKNHTDDSDDLYDVFRRDMEAPCSLLCIPREAPAQDSPAQSPSGIEGPSVRFREFSHDVIRGVGLGEGAQP